MNNLSHSFTIGGKDYCISDGAVIVKKSGGASVEIPFFTKKVFADISNEICFISLHIVHDCVLNCEYCYGVGGRYGKDKPSVMSLEVAQKAVDSAFANMGNQSTLYINFFGGEPLLAFNLVKDIVEYANNIATDLSKRMSYSISTSGLIMSSEILDFWELYKFSVSVSIDGGRIYHDTHRVLRDGKGSFDLVTKNLRKLQERNIIMLDTATITHKTIDSIANIDSLLNLGINNFRFKIATGDIGAMSITKQDVDKICAIYDKLCVRYLKDIENGVIYDFGDYTKWIHRFHKGKYTFSNCTAGRNYFNVDPEGNIFLCHKFVSDKDNIIGHVSEMKFPKIIHHVDNYPCSNCWAKYICGGGCFYDGWAACKDIGKTSGTIKCKIYKKQIEGAIMIYSELYRQDILEKFISAITSTNNEYQTIV